jgi:Skp family chaperone for outer membrane proteins
MIAVLPLLAQATAETLSEQELSVIEAIKVKNRTPEEIQTPPEPPQEPMQVPPHTVNPEAADTNIQLSEQAKQQAFEQQQTQTAVPSVPEPEPEQTQEETDENVTPGKCLTVAFIDIDVAFNEHPRTQAVKKQIDTKIKSKQREVQNAKDIIEALEAENKLLIRQLADLKPFYARIVTDQPLGPKVPESTDSLILLNMLNRLSFAECEILSTSPLNTPAQLEDIAGRIGENKKIIAERSYFIDNYKYQTREEILKLEQEEVKAILQDIYAEIKSFAQKRNIGAVVRKDEILYGQKPINVTKDFVNRLKKVKKYRKK